MKKEGLDNLTPTGHNEDKRRGNVIKPLNNFDFIGSFSTPFQHSADYLKPKKYIYIYF